MVVLYGVVVVVVVWWWWWWLMVVVDVYFDIWCFDVVFLRGSTSSLLVFVFV